MRVCARLISVDLPVSILVENCDEVIGVLFREGRISPCPCEHRLELVLGQLTRTVGVEYSEAILQRHGVLMDDRRRRGIEQEELVRAPHRACVAGLQKM
jgi:hypothetical protein